MCLCMEPLFIVFEGIDGSGKTTQAKKLNNFLNKNGIKSIYKHVFDSECGRMLRDIFINNNLSNTVEILILCATRQSYLEENLLDCKNYEVIIIDRFFLSILSMQGKDKHDVELIRYLQNYICKGFKEHIVYYIDTLPKECDRRINNNRIRDRIEKKGIEFHESVSNRYKTLINQNEETYVFNGNDDVDSVHKAIANKTMELLCR